MNPCDPSLAPLRCWGHEDCLEHAELALACGPDRDYPWGGGFLTNTTDALSSRGEAPERWGGDGWEPYGHGAGRGFGYGFDSGDGFGKSHHDGFGVPFDCEEEDND